MADKSDEEMLEEVILTPGETTNNSFALTDAVKLLTSTINSQFQQLAEKLQEDSTNSAQLLKKKLKDNIAGKLKFEGNRVQYIFNEECIEELDKLKDLSSNDKDTVKRLREKINTRQKHIRIADGSPAGWKTVQEYQLNDVAENSDDEKRIRSAENRALKQTKQGKKSRFSPYLKPAQTAAAGSPAQLPSYGLQQQNNVLQTANPFLQPFRAASRRTPQPSDVCYKCFQTGHWKSRCPSQFGSTAPSSSK
ncbi:uncharacterized protein LOC128187855 [Crassostrea angulata]|uniref:uncharacterized protein LOC128187855 n=1 Tax=Magallana angulata TaxID=2784310 RepID=UPI0022B18DA3|nr:uncharacterized protein LOC128187855 [Crassostrea angulata]